MKSKRVQSGTEGFTLLEILIALFIFTILSTIMAAALRSVINSQSGTEKKAERLRQLQMAVLMLSRDIEQAVNRPILSALGKEEAAFIGTPRNFIFTHAGFANLTSYHARSTLQRTEYSWNEDTLSRLTWPVLDQAPQTKAHTKQLLTNVSDVHFEYLTNSGRFSDHWPLDNDDSQPLPRAIRIYVTISQWGKLSQLYIIAAQSSKNVQLTKPEPTDDKQQKS